MALSARNGVARTMPPGQRKGEYVYQMIKRDLIAGAFALGEGLSAADVAADLGTSRQPVMDALKRLQIERFVEVIPQVGCRVAIPTESDVEDFYKVFAALEGLITGMAAVRRDGMDVDRLATAAKQLSVSMTGDYVEDNRRYAQANRGFHGAVHDLARSPEARRAAESYWDRSDFLISSARPPFWRTEVEQAHRDHDEMVEAVREQDAHRAAELASRHIGRFGEAVVAHLLVSTSGANRGG